MGDDQVTNRLTAGGDVSGPVIQSGGSVTINPRGKAELAAVIAIIALATALILALTSDNDDVPGKAVAETTAITTEPAVPTTTTVEPTTTTVEPTTTTAEPTTSETTTIALPPTYGQMYTVHWRLRETNVDVIPPREETSGSTSFSVYYLPGVRGGPATADLYAGLPQNGAGAVAEWDGPREPRPEDCLDQVNRVGSDQVAMTEGGAYCLVTERGTVAHIYNVEFLESGVYANITAWSPQP